LASDRELGISYLRDVADVLPVRVGGFDHIVVYQAQPALPRNEDMGSLQARLSIVVHVGQDYLVRTEVKLSAGQASRCMCPHGSSPIIHASRWTSFQVPVIVKRAT
jgi:hypothetical protein